MQVADAVARDKGIEKDEVLTAFNVKSGFADGVTNVTTRNGTVQLSGFGGTLNYYNYNGQVMMDMSNPSSLPYRGFSRISRNT